MSTRVGARPIIKTFFGSVSTSTVNSGNGPANSVSAFSSRTALAGDASARAQVLRETRLGMVDDRVAADDEVPNAMPGE